MIAVTSAGFSRIFGGGRVLRTTRMRVFNPVDPRETQKSGPYPSGLVEL